MLLSGRMWFHKTLVIVAVVAGPVVAAAAEGTLASKHVGAMRGHGVAVAETVLETETATETGAMWEDGSATTNMTHRETRELGTVASSKIQTTKPPTKSTSGNVTIEHFRRFTPENREELDTAVNAWCNDNGYYGGEGGTGSDDGSGSGSSEDPSVEYGEIGTWDIRKVTDLSYLFSQARNPSCEQTVQGDLDLSGWDTSRVITMKRMFEGLSGLTGVTQSKWNTAKVVDMSGMFAGCSTVNYDLSRWKTGKVKTMANMFAGAGDFNSDLSKWDTRQVTDMRAMFQAASTFNSNIGRWVTSKVTDMKYMFEDAGEFNQALCWPRSKTLQTTNMWKRSMIGRWGTGKPGACF